MRWARVQLRAFLHHQRGGRSRHFFAHGFDRLAHLGRVLGTLEISKSQCRPVVTIQRLSRTREQCLKFRRNVFRLGRLVTGGNGNAEPPEARGIVPAEIHANLQRLCLERSRQLPHGLARLALTPTGGPAGLQVAIQRGHRAGIAAPDPLLGVVLRTVCQRHLFAVGGHLDFAQEKIALRPFIISAARTTLRQALVRQSLKSQRGDVGGQVGKLQFIGVVLGGVALHKDGIVLFQLHPAERGRVAVWAKRVPVQCHGSAVCEPRLEFLFIHR